LRVPVDDSQINAVTRVYGNKQGDIEYLRFLNDADCLNMSRLYDGNRSKITYIPDDIDFTGAKDISALLSKIKEHVYRHRIRLGEFF